MLFKLAMLSAALLAGPMESASGQAKPSTPDSATVTRLQREIAQAQAKGDLQREALDLRILIGLYKNDPSMRSITYQQLAQVSTQLHDDAKAAEYHALAQGLPATVSVAPAANPPAAAAQASDIFAAPVAEPQVPAAPGPQPTNATASSTDKLSTILAKARQIMAQAKQMQQAMKQKGSDRPVSGQPAPPQPNNFPPAPDGVAAAPAPPAEVAPAAGVVIGYDANNQPIFAPAQPAPAAPPQQYPAPPK